MPDISGVSAQRLPIVGVMGSGTSPHAELSEPLGDWLARLGVHLLTGGGGGVMECVGRAFCAVPERRGLSLGVLPGDPGAGGAPPPGYPNSWVEIPLRTHLPSRGLAGAGADSRNHINVLSCDVVVALPGGEGTASEVALARRYGRPVAVFARSRESVPALPPGVEVYAELAQVQAFVRAHLPPVPEDGSG